MSLRYTQTPSSFAARDLASRYTVGMRDMLILVALALAAVVIGAVIYLTNAPGSGGQGAAALSMSDPGVAVPVDTLVVGTQSQITTPTNYLITSKDELAQLWSMTDAAGQVPAVDFSTHSVLAVFAGQEPTAGYSIAISSIADSSTTRMVTITLTKPGGSCVVGQVVTTPYEIVSVPKTALTLTHTDVTSTASCI